MRQSEYTKRLLIGVFLSLGVFLPSAIIVQAQSRNLRAAEIFTLKNGSAVPRIFIIDVKKHQIISLEIKQNGMDLKQLKRNPKIEIVTDTDEKFSCGLAFFKINGKSSTAVRDILWKEHKIKVAAIENYKNNYVDYAGVNSLGVATPVYITTKELNKFIQTIERII